MNTHADEIAPVADIRKTRSSQSTPGNTGRSQVSGVARFSVGRHHDSVGSDRSIGARIRALREAAGYTQAKLAAELRVRETTLSSWERDKTLPNADAITGLRSALGCTYADLLGSPEGLEAPPDPLPSAPSVHGVTPEQVHAVMVEQAFRAFLRTPVGSRISPSEHATLASIAFHDRVPNTHVFHAMLVALRICDPV